MAQNRMISTSIWDDEWFTSLDALEQHLFMYFLTNGATNVAGVYQLPLRRISFDTGMDQEKVKKMLGRFTADGKVIYEMGWVILPNWLRHQRFNSNQWVAVENVLNSLPEWLKVMLFNPNPTIPLSFETVSNGNLMIEKGSLTIRYKRRKEEKEGRNNAGADTGAKGSPGSKGQTAPGPVGFDHLEGRR